MPLDASAWPTTVCISTKDPTLPTEIFFFVWIPHLDFLRISRVEIHTLL